MTQTTLTIAGRHIAYTVRGIGPFLFLVGAPVGILGFDALASRLADDFTVVTHDPRGIGQSEAVGVGIVTPQMLADDLFTLIQTLSKDSVLLFGVSGGAVTGIDLLTRYPETVRLLVAHEPPLFSLLPNGEEVLYHSDIAFHLAATDPDAGMQAFADLTETLHSTYTLLPRPERIVLPSSSPAAQEKNRYFLNRMAPGTVHYRPDITQLTGKAIRIAAGEASIGQPARQAALALAQALRTPLLDAPGNHLGIQNTERFAQWLRPILFVS